MLHRLALRVLPHLALAVTEDGVRKRKRLIMLVPGLVAFAVYRIAKEIHPLVDPFTVLCLSGLVSAVTALVAYRFGRQTVFVRLWSEDGPRQLGWMLVWIGFAYGIQLSLMVLALLKIVISYDFLLHPDGPAMMAIIIACTSVARDAFEIGHVRWLEASGRPVPTFPDGQLLRKLIKIEFWAIAQWSLLGGLLGVCAAWGLSEFDERGRAWLTQLIAVALTGGTITLWAYLVGVQQKGMFSVQWKTLGYGELFRFWWWPGLAFAATYYLVGAGVLIFVIRPETVSMGMYAAVAGCVSALMAVYAYYLGDRRFQENQVRQAVPDSLLRCPFVMGILTRERARKSATSLESPVVPLGDSAQQSSL